MCSGLIIQFFKYSTVSAGRVVDLRTLLFCCCVGLTLSIMVDFVGVDGNANE